MKLEIYDGTSEPEEKIVRLRLVLDGPGSVNLVVVDKAGDRVSCGSLLCIDDDGTTHSNCNINESIGFNLDSNGRLIIKGRD